VIFKKGVDENNVVNERVAKRFGLPYMAELLSADTFRSDDTRDDCHFNEAGADRMAEKVFQFLLQSKLAPP
jgi:lysophospholipase L1-like esterase